MAKRTATITLEGVPYLVHAFNMRELQEVGQMLGNGTVPIVSGMKIIGLAMQRSDPKCPNIDEIEPTINELNEATATILQLSGIEQTSPQTAAPAGS
jgi:hypothetical protein